MKVETITPSIFHVNYRRQKDMNNAFVRLSAHAECPVHKDTIFTIGSYRKWYIESTGRWTYDTDWGGHNIKDIHLQAFIHGEFDPLTRLEKQLIDLFRSNMGTYCVIGTYGNPSRVLYHELAHGLYYTNPMYRVDVGVAMLPYMMASDVVPEDSLNNVVEMLKGLGYHSDVFKDETHAYTGVDHGYLDSKDIFYPKRLSQELIEIFNTYSPIKYNEKVSNNSKN